MTSLRHYGMHWSVTLDLARLSVQMIVATVVAGVLVALLSMRPK